MDLCYYRFTSSIHSAAHCEDSTAQKLEKLNSAPGEETRLKSEAKHVRNLGARKALTLHSAGTSTATSFPGPFEVAFH